MGNEEFTHSIQKS